MERDEEKRVFVLRIISAAIGVARRLVRRPQHPADHRRGTPGHPEVAFIGYVLCGLAAAGGSSFWHDQLDRIRNVKQIGQQLVSIKTGPIVGIAPDDRSAPRQRAQLRGLRFSGS